MRLKSIRLVNFRQHRDSRIDFPGTGLIGLLGPTAAGKSTIIEAIKWALYGARAIRGTLADLRWLYAPGRQTTSVELCFAHGGHDYRLLRRENGADLYEDANPTPRATGTETVTTEIAAAVLGMTLEEFENSHFASQDDLNRLSRLKPTERTQFILRANHVDQIDRAIAEARERKNDFVAQRRGLLAGLGDPKPLHEEEADAREELARASADREIARQRLEATTAEAAGADVALRESETRRARADSARDAHRAAAHALDLADRELTRAQQDVDNARAAADRAAASDDPSQRLAECRAARDHLLQAQTTAARARDLRRTIDSANHALARLNTEIDQLAAIATGHDPDALARSEAGLAAATEHLEALRLDRASRRATAEAEGNAAAARITAASDRLTALDTAGPDGICPLCETPLGAQLPVTRRAIETELATARADRHRIGQIYRTTLAPSAEENAAEAAVMSAASERDQAREADAAHAIAAQRLAAATEIRTAKEDELDHAMNELDSLPPMPTNVDGEVRRLDREIAELAERERSTAADQVAAARVPELAATLATALQHRADHSAAAQAAAEAAAAAGFDPDQHRQLAEQAKRASTLAADQATSAATAATRVEAARARLRRARTAISDYEARHATADESTAAIALLTDTTEALLAFRQAQVDAIRPELEERMTRYVATLTDGRYSEVTLDDAFDVRLVADEHVQNVISGGSIDVAALAMRLALSEIIAERAGAPISLMVLDEPFASLDRSWRDNVLSLLRRLQDHFEQIFVISHDGDVEGTVDLAISVAFNEEGRFAYVTTPDDYTDAAAA